MTALRKTFRQTSEDFSLEFPQKEKSYTFPEQKCLCPECSTDNRIWSFDKPADFFSTKSDIFPEPIFLSKQSFRRTSPRYAEWNFGNPAKN